MTDMSLFRRRRRKPTWLKPPLAADREAARAVLAARVDHWAAQMGIRPNKVFIRNQQSRWGSASSLGNISLNWRVAGLPEHIQDYIVVHELAHLREMNHSRDFWALVAEYQPNHQVSRQWLRKQRMPVA